MLEHQTAHTAITVVIHTSPMDESMSSEVKQYTHKKTYTNVLAKLLPNVRLLYHNNRISTY